MALCFLAPSIFTCSLWPKSHIIERSSGNGGFLRCRRLQSMAVTTKAAKSERTIVRRSANYQPPIWDYNYVQKLQSEYVGESYTKRAEKLKVNVRTMLDQVVEPLHQLELIDLLQKLGLSYHFEDEIRRILDEMHHDNCSNHTQQEGLHQMALKFRLLRQYGYHISPEVFNRFRDENGNFETRLGGDGDCQGILSLHEAVYHLAEGEDDMFHEIRNFTTAHLRKLVENNEDKYLCAQVKYSLEFPLHWRISRSKTRWFIDVYEKSHCLNPALLELAKLDFNIVQAKHQEELKHLMRWWRELGLLEELSFSRDRMTENFLWSVGMTFEPQFEYCRRIITKIIALLTVIDDIYDVYGTLDELELFTNVVERWDINAIDELPHYMKLYFIALQNTINDIAFDVLKKLGVNILSYLKKAWTDLCKSYLLEARWFHSVYIPTLEEYINNASITMTGPLLSIHTYFSIINPRTEVAILERLASYLNILRYSSLVGRLADDLVTSSDELKRGDVLKSIQCYMHEAGVSEDEAREHIQDLISATWMKMNKERLENLPIFSNTFIDITMSFARSAQLFYMYGDGYGIQDLETKDNVLSLLINPIPLK